MRVDVRAMVRRLAVALATTGLLATAVPAASAAEDAYDVTVRRDSFGVPHVVADDHASLGYGLGYAFAQDNLCTLMDYTVTVNGERSRWFGPDATWTFHGNGTTNTNLASDFHYAGVNASGVIEDLIAQPPPNGPLPEVTEAVRGYVAGINRHLADIGGADGITDPRCAGAPWVRPLTEMDAYRRFFQLASLASAGVAVEGIGTAQPPTGGVVPTVPGVTDQLPVPGDAPVAADPVLAGQLDALQQLPGRISQAIGIGSNAYALGRDATDNGRGMVLGNPHFPWQGGERLYQMHLTIPGTLDVAGAGLYGVPLVLIGHTDGVAWSHTVSTAYRFTPYELTLVPGDPTSYLVDGQPEAMTSEELTVEVLEDDGSVGTRTRTLWSTRYGPMLTSVLGLPLFPWTPVKAYALADANRQVRYLNQFFTWNHAQSAEELFELQQTYLGIPWVNTIAADRDGDALYSDVSVVPNVPDEMVATCSGALGLVTFAALGLPTLDGSRSDCAWRTDPDAPVAGIFGPGNLPHLFRDDYVTNSNDSYWLSNPAEPLEGFARIIGDERTARTLRTRLGLVMVEERLAGTDEYVDAVSTRTGLPAGDRYTQDVLQATVFNNRQHAGELTRDEVVGLCTSLGGTAPTSGGAPVSTDGACDALAGWDLRDDLDSAGAILFRRFWSNLTASPLPLDLTGIVTDQLPPEVVAALPTSLVAPTGAPWQVAFDPADPVHTPRDLDTANPRVALALGDAIADLAGAGIPLDAGLRGWQVERIGDEVIDIHGGPGTLGVFNAINVTWDPERGYPDVDHGSSFVMAAQFVDPDENDGCGIDADAIVTYSQAEDVTRPFASDQTRMYRDKQWNPMWFCEDELLADPGLEVTRLTTAPTPTPAPDTPDPDPAPTSTELPAAPAPTSTELPAAPAPAPSPSGPPLPATGGGLGLLALGALATAGRLRASSRRDRCG